MTTENGARYVIIGAGIHGLSTAWHLARRLRASGKGDGGDVLVVDKTGCRGGRVRRRLRGGAQQLLPARDAGADGALGRGLGVRSGGVRLPRRGIRADRPGGHAQRRRADLRRAAGHRLRVGAGGRRGGVPHVHDGHVLRLARARHVRRPAREARRVRQQRGVAQGAGGEGRGGGRHDPVRRAGDRAGARRRCGDGGADRPGRRPVRPPGDRGRPVDPRPLGHARPARPHPRHRTGRDRAPGPADVDVLGAAGGHPRGRPARPSSTTRARYRRCCTWTPTSRCTTTPTAAW